MRILISNDDGYFAPGIEHLAAALARHAEITVVAPERDRSGASNSLTLDRPLLVRRAPNGFLFVNGTPTDCVHLAVTGLLDHRPDMVVSGINLGANMGDDTIYSGTVAAATEGYLLGVPAIAVSLASGNDFANFDTAARVARELVERIRRSPIGEPVLLNVNVPDVPYEQLGREHHALEALLVKLEGNLAGEEPPGSTQSLAELLGGLQAARGLWHPHIRLEEEHLSAEILGPLLPAEEHVRLGRASAEHSQAHAGPDYLVVPFFLYNLEQGDRAALVRIMPPIVTQELVPHVWLDKWASMKPFLLG